MAERPPDPEEFPGAPPEKLVPDSIVFTPPVHRRTREIEGSQVVKPFQLHQPTVGDRRVAQVQSFESTQAIEMTRLHI